MRNAAGRSRTLRALVWRRQDWRESSRLVTLLTREEGKLLTLAKGAHRPGSVFMGRLDLLNLVQARVHGSGGGLQLLAAVTLQHEPRALRQPPRFLAASHLVELFDHVLLDGRADAQLFDLLSGAVVLLERAPLPSLATVLAGVELRFLEALGLLPDLNACGECGGAAGGLRLHPHGHGLACGTHAPPRATRVSAAALAFLSELRRRPGATWPELPSSPHRAAALGILGTLVQVVLERRPRWRAAALEALHGRRAPALAPRRHAQSRAPRTPRVGSVAPAPEA